MKLIHSMQRIRSTNSKHIGEDAFQLEKLILSVDIYIKSTFNDLTDILWSFVIASTDLYLTRIFFLSQCH